MKRNNAFSNYIVLMNEALSRNDFNAYHSIRRMLDEEVDEYQDKQKLIRESKTTNFGVLNRIVEDALPSLFMKNKKVLGKIVKLIKEDKNLSTQFKFYNMISSCPKELVEKVSSDTLLENYLNIIHESVDHKGVVESNKKLSSLLERCGLRLSDHINEDDMRLYRSVDTLFKKRPSLSNANLIQEACSFVSDYMDEHKTEKKDEENKVYEMIDTFEKNLKTNLNEDERSLVSIISMANKPIYEQRKNKVFDSFKNECIKAIDKMIKENGTNSELESLKTQINEMAYSSETVTKDLAKLLEIRDILIEK